MNPNCAPPRATSDSDESGGKPGPNGRAFFRGFFMGETKTGRSRWPDTSRHTRGYGSAWNRIRVIVLKRDGNLCQCERCKTEGRIAIATEVDHVVSRTKAKSLGWTEERTEHPNNLQAINSVCHERKTIEEQGKRARKFTKIGLDGYPIGL